jgi:hypothetical protein
MCEPLFEEMITALQQSILQQSTRQACFEHAMSNVSTMQSMNQPGVVVFPFQATPVYRPDDESTEASDSCAFTSLFSVMSSEGETLDVIERRSDISEPSCNDDKTIMVCKHWKSKGWCRLGSTCKFLHPEHKRGCCSPQGCSGGDINNEVVLHVPTLTRKRRGGKKTLKRGPESQLGCGV